jgi:hypothetical protein
VVLSLLWFGPGGLGPLFTVAITAMPIVCAATLQGSFARSATRRIGAGVRIAADEPAIAHYAAGIGDHVGACARRYLARTRNAASKQRSRQLRWRRAIRDKPC